MIFKSVGVSSGTRDVVPGRVHFSRARRPRPAGSGRQRPAGWGSSGQAGPPTGGPVGEPRDRPWSRRPPGRGRDDGPRLPARSSPLARGLRAGGEGGLRRRAGPPGPPVEPRPPRPFPVAAGRRFPDGAGVGRARAPRVRGRLPRALPTSFFL
jgi:hypothetical protein